VSKIYIYGSETIEINLGRTVSQGHHRWTSRPTMCYINSLQSTGIALMAAKRCDLIYDGHFCPFRWLGDTNDHVKPGLERVQALADISRSRCCHSNAICAPIANLPKSP